MKLWIGKKVLCLSFAAAIVALAWLPTAATAVRCCSTTTHITYFADPGRTQLVGSCTYNEACAGANYCSGQKTAYYWTSTNCCPNCGQ